MSNKKKIKIEITNIVKSSINEFYDNFLRLRENHSEKDTVLVREKEYYKNCLCFYVAKHKDIVVGTVAVTNDNEIVSLLTDNENYYHVGSSLMVAAVIGGGRKLDCYNVNRLRIIYHRLGFVPVAKVVLPKNHQLYLYNSERDCEILYWIFNEDSGFPFRTPIYDESKEVIKEFTTTLEAEKYRDSLILKHYSKSA